jgi:hypothetical protein
MAAILEETAKKSRPLADIFLVPRYRKAPKEVAAIRKSVKC